MLSILRFKLILILALLLPAAVFAQAPGAVSGIEAVVNDDGEIEVSYEPATGDIAYYRIYFSQRSILENGGVYDDFESTDGPETTYVLQNPPEIGAVYVAILAVSADGSESEVFLEEASVVRTLQSDEPLEVSVAEVPESVLQMLEEKKEEEASGPSAEEEIFAAFELVSPEERETAEEISAEKERIAAQQEVIPEWDDVSDGGILHLLLAHASSPTVVEFTFTHTPTVQAELAPQAFNIEDENGLALRIDGITIDRETIYVYTEEQEYETTYTVKLSEPLRGKDGEPLSLEHRTVDFIGHPDGLEPGTREAPEPIVIEPPVVLDPDLPTVDTSEASAEVDPVPAPSDEQLKNPSPVTNLALTPLPNAKSGYDLHIEWDIEDPFGNLVSYTVRQSRDRGETYNNPETLQYPLAGLDIPNVTPGDYGVAISVTNDAGYASEEVFENVVIPGTLGNERTSSLPQIEPPLLPTSQAPIINPPVQPPAQQVINPPILPPVQPSFTLPTQTQQIYIPPVQYQQPAIPVSTLPVVPPLASVNQMLQPPRIQPTSDLSRSGGLTLGGLVFVGGSIVGWRRSRK